MFMTEKSSAAGLRCLELRMNGRNSRLQDSFTVGSVPQLGSHQIGARRREIATTVMLLFSPILQRTHG
jgi:hypothetical protein